MGYKRRWPAAFVHPIATELVAQLQPRCEQICIAGSLRRGTADVGDIEILYVPRMGQVRVPGELFSQSDSLADELLEEWLTKGVLTKRPNINSISSWGRQNKLAVHKATRIPLDLFATSADRWFVSLVVRTGSKDTNVRLAASALRRGLKLEAYGGVISRADTGERVQPQSEREVFELCGVPYLEPSQR